MGHLILLDSEKGRKEWEKRWRQEGEAELAS